MTRWLALSSVVMLSGCSLLFTLFRQPPAECQRETTPASCIDESTSLVCATDNTLLSIDCGGSGCDEDTGECTQFCGDDFVQRANGEECDPPGALCNFACRFIPVCGDDLLNPADGSLSPAEQCDDGNLLNGDGCDQSCQLETVAEIEPNDDGAPDQQSNPSVVTGNDFSAANAQGPFTQDVLLRGSLRAPGDEDYFSIQNPGDQTIKVRIDAIVELHKKCVDGPFILQVLDEDGVLRSTAEKRDVPLDVCPGITIDMAPGELLHVLMMESSDRSFGDYFLSIDFNKGELSCGDGVIDINEECEGSSEFCDDGCDYVKTCGDNFIAIGEGCDDGNRTDGDGCDANCRPTGSIAEVEPNDLSTPQGPFTKDVLIVGKSDSVDFATDIDAFQVQNTSNTDQTVRVDLFDAREGVGRPCLSPSSAIIGLELLAGDGSLLERSFGQLTSSPDTLRGLDRTNRCGGFSFDLQANELHSIQLPLNEGESYLLQIDFTTCGDGELEAGEECETPDTAGCDAKCQRVAVCGDGILDFPEEQCEDGNTNNGDDCPSDCILVSGVTNESEFNGDGVGAFGFVNQTFTGDAVIFGAFQSILDQDSFRIKNNSVRQATVSIKAFSLLDGIGQPCLGLFTRMRPGGGPGSFFTNTNNGNCEGLEGTLAPNGFDIFAIDTRFSTGTESAYLIVIEFAECGNGDIEFNEECEPPNSALCDSSCQRIPICGDNLVDAPESCDDGNLIDDDGCSSTCQAENTGFDCPNGQTLLQVASTDVPKNIPDNNLIGAESLVSITDNRTVKKVIVGIDSLTHTFDSDLQISLISPTNTEVLLFDKRGTDGDNLTNTFFDDGCFNTGGTIAAGAAPFSGCFSPEAPLAALNNQSANGQWKLKLVDAANLDTGTLNAWTLGLCVQ